MILLIPYSAFLTPSCLLIPVLTWMIQRALLVTPTLVTAITFLLTLRGGDGNGEIKGTVEGQVLPRQSDDSSSEERRLEEAKAPSPILENPSHREELTKDRESEGNAYTHSGRQVKPVRKDGMYYY